MKYLIIGASGFLGCTIYEKLKKVGKQVIGTYCHHSRNGEFIQIDLLKPDTLISLYHQEKPDIIIWAVRNYELEEEIVESTLQPLLQQLKNCRFLFVSTSVAMEENMSETIAPFIRTEDMYIPHYFNGKIKAEQMLQKYDNYVIVRPGSIYGMDAYGNLDMRTQCLKEHIQNKEKYIRAKNICFSIVEVNELADAIIELAENSFVGIINISEDKPISHYDFNVALCKRYGLDMSYVVGNYEEENIYYLNNTLRKRVLKTFIGELERAAY